MRKLERLDQRLGETIAADLDGANPDSRPVGYDQVGLVGPNVHQQRRAIAGSLLVVLQEVVQRQRRHLHDIDVHLRFGKVRKRLVDVGSLHRKNADFHVRAVGVMECLPPPDDVIDGERNLLLGLEPYDVGDLLRLDRRKFDESREATLARNGYTHLRAGHVVSRQELLQRLANYLSAVDVGLRQRLGMLGYVDRLDVQLATLLAKFKGLEGSLPNIDAPNGIHLCHDNSSACGSSITRHRQLNACFMLKSTFE